MITDVMIINFVRETMNKLADINRRLEHMNERLIDVENKNSEKEVVLPRKEREEIAFTMALKKWQEQHIATHSLAVYEDEFIRGWKFMKIFRQGFRAGRSWKQDEEDVR